MQQHTLVDPILDRLPRNHWNSFSRLLSFFTVPTIGSPVEFWCKGFTLKEYDLQTAPEMVLHQYFLFCYPAGEIEDPHGEFEIDKQYFSSAFTFIITRDSDNTIVGCIQLIARNETVKLPVEYSVVEGEKKGCHSKQRVLELLPNGNYAEIYRCRKAPSLTGEESVIVVPMLFKAALAKLFQTNIDYSILSFDKSNVSLRNLYCRKLAFKRSGISVLYPEQDKKWEVLYIPTLFFIEEFASVSKTHFKLITYFRSNLKKRGSKNNYSTTDRVSLSLVDTVFRRSRHARKENRSVWKKYPYRNRISTSVQKRN